MALTHQDLSPLAKAAAPTPKPKMSCTVVATQNLG
jgi:hypothetical protein